METGLSRLQSMLPVSFTEERMKSAIRMLDELSLPMRKLMSYYTCAMMEIETKLKVLNEEFSLQYDRNPINSIKTRLKSNESIALKMVGKGLPLTSAESIEKNLNDVAGVRVICAFTEDVYMLADALLKQDDITLVKRKDYIKEPKENGYRSLHLIVEVPIFLANEKRPMRVEVQLRTIAMDFWASLEHQLRYKKDLPCSSELSVELKTCADKISQLDEQMQSIRSRINQG